MLPPLSACSSFSFFASLDGVTVEAAWDQKAQMLCLRDVSGPQAVAALEKLGLTPPGTVTATMAVQVPTSPARVQLAPDVAARAVQHNEQATAAAPPTGNGTNGHVPQTPPPPAAQPAAPAQPSGWEATFARAVKMSELVEGIIQEGAHTSEAVVARAKDIRAKGISPFLNALPPDEVESRAEAMSVAALDKAGF